MIGTVMATHYDGGVDGDNAERTVKCGGGQDQTEAGPSVDKVFAIRHGQTIWT